MAPIHNAAYSGNVNRVRALLNSGANINARDVSRFTPLITAVSSKHLAVVKELLDRGANINSQTRFGWTPLYMAVWRGNLPVVRLLLDRGAKINARDENGRTALIDAAAFGNLPMVKLLLNRGANTKGVLNSPRIKENVKNVIRRHKAGLTIAKHYKAATLRRRLSFIGSNMAKSLPRNMTRKILTSRK